LEAPAPAVVVEAPAPLTREAGGAEKSARSRPEGVRGALPSPEQSARLWGRGVMVGGTFGLGAPGGLAGLVVQLDPSRYWGLSWSGGLGGLGPAFAVQGWLRPLPPAGEWTPVLGAGLSLNVIPEGQRAQPDQALPVAARWFNVEVASEWRVVTGRVVRFGLGHAFLLNGGQFGCRAGVNGACQAASESSVPGWAPYGGGAVGVRDLIVSGGRGDPIHLWFIHVDFGALFPF